MSKSLFATLTLIVSVDVENKNDEMAILEGAYKIGDEAITQCILTVRDLTGKLHNVDVHDWKSEIHRLVD